MKTINVGKSSTNDFVVHDDSVSRWHARLTVSDTGSVTIRDLNSTNGTFVDGQRITGETALRPGQSVRLGNRSIDWQQAIASHARTAVHPKPAGSGAVPPGTVASRSIGRQADNAICLNHSDVSGHHAILCLKQGGAVSIVDCNSTNGTYVNGRRITGETALKPGDTVMIAQKYPVNWQSLFPGQKPQPISLLKTAGGQAAAVILLMGVAFALYWLWPWGEKELKPSEIYTMYKKSVVFIYEGSGYSVTVEDHPIGEFLPSLSKLNYCHIDSDGDVAPGPGYASGTGFFISDDGKIMTNKHVVAPMRDEAQKEAAQIKESVQTLLLTFARQAESKEMARKLQAMARAVEVEYELLYLGIGQNDTHVSSTDDFIRCSLVKVSQDDKVDAAIIQTNTKQTPSDVTHLVRLDDIARAEDMELGDKVYTIGFPLGTGVGLTDIGLEANNQDGIITQEHGEYTYGHNITIQHGASGSPVFDVHGRFAGIIVSQTEINGVSTGFNQAVQPQKAADLAR